MHLVPSPTDSIKSFTKIRPQLVE